MTHITLLLNEYATRENIIKEFQQLANNNNIKAGDSILIYYAGHGAQALPPKRMLKLDGCPDHIELLIPYDYGKDPKNHQHMGIPDYTLAALLDKIAKAKGDNIVCCMSAIMLRSDILTYVDPHFRLLSFSVGFTRNNFCIYPRA